jgi:ABC-type transport system involved in multi-copper enzyme maturation permease subunit
MITSLLHLLPVAIVLALVQLLAALPWLAALDPREFKAQLRRPAAWGIFLAVVAALGVGLAGFLHFVSAAERLRVFGRFYGAVLHAQLVPDLFVLVFALVLLVWPHGGAVALAAFREGIRQPMFWLIIILAALAMLFSVILPYFTFGEDFKMVQGIGYDLIMLSAVLFGVLAAAISISEEIEGRTAVTLMSKPVSRRQFLLGKFLGLFMSCLAMVGVLGWCFTWVLWIKPAYFPEDRGFNPIPTPAWVAPLQVRLAGLPESGVEFSIGAGLWGDTAETTLPGLLMGSCHAMVLLAIAVALATRLPMILNMVICLAVFFLGHLTQVLVTNAEKLRGTTTGSLVAFVARLFNALLPGLDFFNYDSVLSRELPPDPAQFSWYIATIVVYASIYAAIALLLGLILFEDRDLA